MKKHIILLTILCSVFMLQAQKRSALLYSMVHPPNIQLEGVTKIYIEPFKNSDIGSVSATSPTYIKNSLIYEFRKTWYGLSTNTISSFARTDWYIITENRKEADAVISGTFKSTITQENSKPQTISYQKIDNTVRSWYYRQVPNNENYKQKVGKFYNVPYVIRKFQYKNAVKMDLTMKITDKSGKILFEDNHTGTEEYTTENCIGRHCAIPSSKSIESLEQLVMEQFVNKVMPKLMPTARLYKLNLRKITTKDKNVRKALRKNQLLTLENFLEVARLYAIVFEKEGNMDAAYNIANIYLVTGYMEDAVEWSKKGKLDDSIVIDIVKSYYNQFEANGLPLPKMRVMYN